MAVKYTTTGFEKELILIGHPGSLAIIIPAKDVDRLKLHEGQTVHCEIKVKEEEVKL